MAKATEAAIQAQLSTDINGPTIRKSIDTALTTTVSYYVTVNSPAYKTKAAWVDTDSTASAATIAAALDAALV